MSVLAPLTRHPCMISSGMLGSNFIPSRFPQGVAMSSAVLTTSRPTAPRFIHQEIQFVAFAGPSGVGKNYWVTQLMNCAESNNLAFGEMQSITTRSLRPNQDREYREMGREEFLKGEAKDKFEWVVPVGEHLYGTLREDLKHAVSTRHPWLIHVTHNTVQHIRKFAPGRVLSIFCHASFATLRYNLERRPDNPNREADEVQRDIEKRLARAGKEEGEARDSLQFNVFVDADHRHRSNEDILKDILKGLREFPKPQLW